MNREFEFTAAQIRRLAETIGLQLDDSNVSEFVDPLSAIAASMEPIEHPPEPDHGTSAVESVTRSDPYNAYITQCRVDPSESAADGPLYGCKVALKDNIALAGVERTAGSSVLSGHVPAKNAPVVDRLLASGATIIGKTNMDEFAFGPTGETSAFGATLNPIDTDYTPGGSSSGSAATVAAGDADLALGTDTGGSVRIPASFCGIYGFKPTQGRVPIAGIVELARSLDTVGVLGRNLRLIERGDAVLSGEDPNATVDTVDSSSLTIGIPDALFNRDSDVGAVVNGALERLADTGAVLKSIELPTPERTSAVFRALTMSELYQYVATGGRSYRIPHSITGDEGLASALQANLHRFSNPLRQYLLMGAALVHEDGGRRYTNACAHRDVIRQKIKDAMEDVDVIVSPTTPTTAFEFGSFSRAESRPINGNTHIFNLSGNPAVSLPHGDVDGLPVGLQLVGEYNTDRCLFAIAEGVEAALNN